MITLHRLNSEPFQVNPDLIATVKECPDTVVGLTTGARVIVQESADEVAASLRDFRLKLMAEAMGAQKISRVRLTSTTPALA